MEQFDRYLGLTGKRDSFYLYVLFRCPFSKLKDHLMSIKKSVDQIGDSFRRRLLLGRNHLFLDWLHQNCNEVEMISGIILLHDKLEFYLLEIEWTKNLEKYKCPEIQYQVDDRFDFDWLKDLVTNDQPETVLKVCDKISILEMTKTKSRTIYSQAVNTKESITDVLNQHLRVNTSALVYGTSRFLKDFSHPKAWAIEPTTLTVTEVWEKVEERINNKKEVDLAKDLEYLKLPGKEHRLKFKTEIALAILDGKLGKLYLTQERKDTFLKKCQENGLDITFQIIVLKSKLLDQFDGVIGVTYY